MSNHQTQGNLKMYLRRSALCALGFAFQSLSACGGSSDSGAAGGASSIAGTPSSNAGQAGASSNAGGSSAIGGAGSSGSSAAGALPGGASSGGVSGGGTSNGGAPSGGASSGGVSSGGSSSGGVSSGGVSSGGTSNGGQAGAAAAGGASGCSGLTQTRFARSGKSAGFAGDYLKDYYPLYSHACTTAPDCAAACVTAGGTQASCAASECVDSTPDYCLPPTYWIGFDQLLTQGNSQESSTYIIMVNNPYRDQLLASNFQFEIPSGAKISGISFSITEAAGSENMIADYSVRALSNGVPVGLDRGHSTAWTTTFHPEIYGGASDLWGTTWTADSINAAGFGIGLTPLYLVSAGNERAYVDFIEATVTYDVCK